jgi:MFS family permease
MRSKPMILVALLLAAFLVNLDTTLVNVALPAMVRELHATTTQLQWVVDSYNLVFAALLVIFGSLSDGSGARACCWPGWPSSGAPAGPAVSPPARRSSSRPSPLITMFSMTLRPLRATAK